MSPTGPNMLEVITFLGVAVTLVLLLLGIVEPGRRRAHLRRRAQGIRRRGAGSPARSRNAPTLKRSEGVSVPLVENLAQRLVPRQSALRDRLERSGCEVSVGTYLVVCLALALVSFAGAWLGLRLRPALAGCLAVVLGLGVPNLCVSILIRRHRARFLTLFPEAVDLIVRGLKAGLPVMESIAAVAREMAQPIAGEFRRITDGVRFGRPLEDALWETARRLDMREFDFFVISLSVQRETGGNLAETLGNLSDIVRRRRQIVLKIRALSSEARASAYILGLLPFVMFGLVYAVNREYAMTLLTDPRGIAMLCVALAGIALAIVVIVKLIRFEI